MTVSPGDTTDVFDAYVFNPGVELGVLSPVIKDDTITLQGGYWLIDVVDSEIARKIDDENRLALKNAALNNWLAGLRDDPDNVIVNNLDDEKTQWAVTKVMGG
jgi:hypothetical protein